MTLLGLQDPVKASPLPCAYLASLSPAPQALKWYHPCQFVSKSLMTLFLKETFLWPSTKTFLTFPRFQYHNFLRKTFSVPMFPCVHGAFSFSSSLK